MEQRKERICNGCGRPVIFPQEEGLAVTKTWGYFSRKDGERHSFFLCEDCYDKLAAGFAVPVEIREETELL